MDTVSLFMWLTLRADVLAPARFVVFALAGLLCAWWARGRGAAFALRCQNALRARAWGPPARGSLADLAEDTPVVLRGTLALEDDRLFLRVDGRFVRLTGALAVEDDGQRVDVDAVRRRAREGAEALVRGRVRHERDDDDATYRATPRRGVLKPDGEVVRVVILKAVPSVTGRRRAVALGALLGGVAGATLPFIAARTLGPARCLPRVTWRVASIAPRDVHMAPTVHGATEGRCDIATGLLGPWWAEVSTRPADVVVRDSAGFGAFRAAWPLAPIEPERQRALWDALGDELLVLAFDADHGDAETLRRVLDDRRSSGDVARRALFRLAGLEPLGALVPRVSEAFLTAPDASQEPSPEAALRQLPPDAAAALRCLHAAGFRLPAGYRRMPLDPGAARTMLAMDAPACRILGALAPSQRDDDALRALSALPRTSPVWRPLIDAARNVITLEGVVSGRVHVPVSRSDAYGDPEEQRATLTPGIAMQIERLGELAQRRGHLWLVDRARFPALEALAEAYSAARWRPYPLVRLQDTPLDDPALRRTVDAAWVDRLNEGYRLALASFDDARRRDPRFDAVWRRGLVAGRARAQFLQDQREFWQQAGPAYSTPWGLRRDTWNSLSGLRLERDDDSLRDDPNLDVPRLRLVRRALRANDREALVAALGARTRASVRVAIVAWEIVTAESRPWLAAWAAYPAAPGSRALRLRRFLQRSGYPPIGAFPIDLWEIDPSVARGDLPVPRDIADDEDLHDPFTIAILDALELELGRASRPSALPAR